MHYRRSLTASLLALVSGLALNLLATAQSGDEPDYSLPQMDWSGIKVPPVQGVVENLPPTKTATPRKDWSELNLPTIQAIGDEYMPTEDQPATFGVITFREKGTVCVGLLTRGSCNQ
jgi:hypothetical protein